MLHAFQPAMASLMVVVGSPRPRRVVRHNRRRRLLGRDEPRQLAFGRPPGDVEESAPVLDATVGVATEENPQLECVCTFVGPRTSAPSHDRTSVQLAVPTILGPIRADPAQKIAADLVGRQGLEPCTLGLKVLVEDVRLAPPCRTTSRKSTILLQHRSPRATERDTAIHPASRLLGLGLGLVTA